MYKRADRRLLEKTYFILSIVIFLVLLFSLATQLYPLLSRILMPSKNLALEESGSMKTLLEATAYGSIAFNEATKELYTVFIRPFNESRVQTIYETSSLALSKLGRFKDYIESLSLAEVDRKILLSHVEFYKNISYSSIQSIQIAKEIDALRRELEKAVEQGALDKNLSPDIETLKEKLQKMLQLANELEKHNLSGNLTRKLEEGFDNIATVIGFLEEWKKLSAILFDYGDIAGKTLELSTILEMLPRQSNETKVLLDRLENVLNYFTNNSKRLDEYYENVSRLDPPSAATFADIESILQATAVNSGDVEKLTEAVRRLRKRLQEGDSWEEALKEFEETLASLSNKVFSNYFVQSSGSGAGGGTDRPRD
ncbi:MAG: hypothetical protein DRJ47_04535 [Thermoprotei archaeon]|nr:MAG: hypothetical protein DRJ47_04535 [Thermoprotei archaeon]